MPHLILENKNLILFLNLKFNFMNDILKCSPKRFFIFNGGCFCTIDRNTPEYLCRS